ncbi:NADAR family protein [Simkania negevensis]|uniref:ALL5029 protein n=1 Tax=Simkania negevensis (strain ATCC VR-1471 / DSM 27360 / Z) TaxID=331113 RepID=F8L6J8_SIMNZ|nr:NADAR family protein [Simkania negevensis]CCB88340.1 ALL5029 protein [Simkania negevensis Z]
MLQKICPAPLRDAYSAYQQKGVSDPEFKKIMMRLSLVATQWFIANQTGLPLPAIAVTGSILSVPSAGIGIGSYLLYEAVTNIFSETVLSLGYAVAGWALIEYSDRFAMGLLESLFVETKKPEKPDSKTGEISQEDPIALDFSDPERGVFGAKTIVDSGKLGTQEVVEFFYSKNDTGNNAKAQGPKLTYGGKQQFEYEIFANTAEGEVEIDGIKWKTREHYYQAHKFKEDSPTYKAILACEGEFAAPGTLRIKIKQDKYKGDLLEGRTAIENFATLRKANLEFFKQNKGARELLLSTGKAPIIERNNHPDAWGITFNPGEIKYEEKGMRINRNQQGLILMLVREELSK